MSCDLRAVLTMNVEKGRGFQLKLIFHDNKIKLAEETKDYSRRIKLFKSNSSSQRYVVGFLPLCLQPVCILGIEKFIVKIVLKISLIIGLLAVTQYFVTQHWLFSAKLI